MSFTAPSSSQLTNWAVTKLNECWRKLKKPWFPLWISYRVWQKYCQHVAIYYCLIIKDLWIWSHQLINICLSVIVLFQICFHFKFFSQSDCLTLLLCIIWVFKDRVSFNFPFLDMSFYADVKKIQIYISLLLIFIQYWPTVSHRVYWVSSWIHSFRLQE